jgi:energy-coupling factor transport system ATP-binding protein
VAPTVADEIRLHCGGRLDLWKQREDLCALFDLIKELGKKPFQKQLSGGQETLVAIVSRLSRDRKYLGLDTCVEQLSLENRARLYNEVFPLFGASAIEVIDNRLDEVYGEAYAGSKAGAGNPLPDFTKSRARACGALSFEGVAFRYAGGSKVFRDLSFTFTPGIHRLTGQNGAGKSTAAKLLIGLLRPAQGRITISGREIRPYDEPGTYGCMAFQDPSLQFSERTVGRLVGGSPWQQELAVAFGLTRHLKEHPLDLPWTMQKRLAVLVAVARETPVTILDEPTVGQDATYCALLAETLSRLSKAGTITIVITHSEKFEVLKATELSLEGQRLWARN